MKVFNSRKNWKTIQRIWKDKDLEMFLAYDFSYFLAENQPHFHKDKIKDLLNLIKDQEVDKEKFLLYLMLKILLQDLDTILPYDILQRMVNAGYIFHAKELNENPYIKNIKIPEIKEGNFKLFYNTYEEYEFFTCTFFRDEPTNLFLPTVAYIDDKFYFPTIAEKDEVWMAITPTEIITMQKEINKAHGKVLTLGCGLGYFAYMAAIKDNVESVTIVEKSPEVISLFKKYILPQFGKLKDKVSIIESDAIEYMQSLEDGVYDYCFADIWKSNMDIEPYLKLKPLEKKFNKMEITYWVEYNLVASNIQSMLLVLMSDNFEQQKKINDLMTLSDNIIRVKAVKEFVEDVFQDVYIKTSEDILYYLNPENILSQINKKYKFGD